MNDLDDCDIGDNDRYKILLDLEGIEVEYRTYIDNPEQIFDMQNDGLYNQLILKKAM